MSEYDFTTPGPIRLFVEDGSFVTLETAWGDDAWRWTYRRGRMTERTVAAGCRAS